MRPRRLLLAALVATLACASSPGGEIEPASPRGDTKTITSADIAHATQLNLLDFIAAERPQWLRGPDGRTAPVTVYVDDSRIGGPSTLSWITLTTVSLVRYYEATAAQQKFIGAGRGAVIHVITR
jgi:hypothetical protein